MPPGPRALSARVEGTPVRATLHGRSDTTVLLVHGLLADSRELGSLPEALAKRGLSALAVDLRGHGQSGGPRGIVSRERAMADILAWKYQLSEEGCRLSAVFGHSLGGAWAVAAAPLLGLDAIGMACTPATVIGEVGRIEEAGYRVGGAVHKLAARLGKGDLWVPYKITPKDALDDPKAIERMKAEGVIQRRVPLALVDPLLRVDVAAWAQRVSGPALVAIADGDRVVRHESTQRVYDALAGPKTWLELPGGHSCFYDGQGDACAAAVADWFAETLGQ